MAGPPVMTYNSLVAQVIDYCNRDDADFVAAIPNFIYQAENRLSRESKNIGQESYVVSAFVPGESVIAKPARWRRNLSLNFGTGSGQNVRNQLFLRSYEFVRNYWPNSLLTAPPVYYADYGYSQILVAPTPDQAYPFEYCFLQLPDPLSDQNQTNFLTNYCADLLLYATLLETASYLKTDERLPMWQSMYDRALASMNAQDDQRVVDRASNRESD